ncbi:hypothetical protein [Dichotomicrobium thermohalophilum]|nr:hypothetical protein [Dichotomicrobium thermohalophilum]
MIVLGHADSGTAAGARPSQQTIAAIRRTGRNRVKAELRNLEKAKVFSARREGDGRGRKITYDFIPDQTIEELQRAMAKDGDTHEATQSTWGQNEPKSAQDAEGDPDTSIGDDAIAPGDTAEKGVHDVPRSEKGIHGVAPSRDADDGRGYAACQKGVHDVPKRGYMAYPRSAPDLPPTFARAREDGAAASLGTPHAPQHNDAGIWVNDENRLRANPEARRALEAALPEMKPGNLLRRIESLCDIATLRGMSPRDLFSVVRREADRIASDKSFDRFWSAYPLKRKGKEKARLTWRKLGADDRRAATDAIPAYQRDCEAAGLPVMDAWRYLTNRAWERPLVNV